MNYVSLTLQPGITLDLTLYDQPHSERDKEHNNSDINSPHNAAHVRAKCLSFIGNR